MRRVEGNVSFHTARSTAFTQPAPGTAPSPGPLVVPSATLSSVLGVREARWTAVDPHLAVKQDALG